MPISLRRSEILRSVDVPNGSWVITFQQNDLSAIAAQESSGTFVALESDEPRIERPAEADRVASPPGEGGRGDGGACQEGSPDGLDRFRLDERHVGQRDEPAVGVGRARDAVREARAHPLGSPGEGEDLEPLGAEQLGERLIVDPDDGDGAVDRTLQDAARADADGSPVLERGEELAAAEPGAGARREEDADDHGRALRPLGARSQCRASASQESRTVPGRMIVSSLFGPVERSVIGAPTASSSAET
jgi:hypothetical protein